MNNISSQIYLFLELTYVELVIKKQNIINEFIDYTIWAGLQLFVFIHIMPYFGLSEKFNIIQLSGIITGIPIYDLYPNIFRLMIDIEHEKVINYQVLLPTRLWVILLSKVLSYVIIIFIISIAILPICQLCLWNKFSISSLSFFKFFLILLINCIFSSVSSLFLSLILKSSSQLGIVWNRIIFPLWFMGGFQFSWFSLFSFNKYLAYICLLNPVTYINEATRVALFTQKGYINFWICIFIIIILSVLLFLYAHKKLKKKLDFI